MKVTKTFSLDAGNIEWLQKQDFNMSEFLDKLISKERGRDGKDFGKSIPWFDHDEVMQQTFDLNKERSEQFYLNWQNQRSKPAICIYCKQEFNILDPKKCPKRNMKVNHTTSFMVIKS